MAQKLNPDEKGNVFTIQRKEDVIVISLEGNLLLAAADLTTGNKLVSLLEALEKDEATKGVVILFPPEKIGRRDLIEFYHHIFKLKMGVDAIHRMFNTVDQILLRLLELNKVVVYAGRGKAVSLFLSIGLVCDYRLVAEDTVFQNPYFELGSVPKGGGGFLLPRFLGLQKAGEIMRAGRDIDAAEALELGIVHQVVPADRLAASALNAARDFCRRPLSSLIGIKKLLNYHLNDLKEYLAMENQVLLKIIKSPSLKSEFWKNVEELYKDLHF